MLGFGEIVFIICLGILLFNIRRIPEIGGSLRKTFKGFKQGIDGTEERRIKDVTRKGNDDSDA